MRLLQTLQLKNLLNYEILKIGYFKILVIFLQYETADVNKFLSLNSAILCKNEMC